MARYGNQKTPYKENMPPKPENPYGIAKVATEDTLKLLCEFHGMEYNIAVPHNIVSPNQKYDDPFRNVISIFINRNLQNKPCIIYRDGEQKKMFFIY
jgi:UDP-glucose 4-epimerase